MFTRGQSKQNGLRMEKEAESAVRKDSHYPCAPPLEQRNQ